MAIWAFNLPGNEYVDFIAESLQEGISRFGWSYIDSADLRILSEKSWGEMSEDEIIIWNKSNFLLNIKKDDWIVHINIPEWGTVTAGKVVEVYDFDPNDNDLSDMRHFFRLDIDSIIEFDRNDDNVHPLISRKLKLRGKHWRINTEKEFFETLENVRSKSINSNNKVQNKGWHYLRKDIEPLYSKITNIIHNTHPEKKLEYFFADIFEKIPNVTDVKVNGSGWGTDYGADLVVTYKTGLDILDLVKEETLVVQIKSFEGDHWDTEAVEQIKTAIKTFNANAGLIITTANSTVQIEKEIERVSNKLGTPISLLAGGEVAKFVLKFGSDLVLGV